MMADDFNKIGLHISHEFIAQIDKVDSKKLRRCKVCETVLRDLLKQKDSHSKVSQNIWVIPCEVRTSSKSRQA